MDNKKPAENSSGQPCLAMRISALWRGLCCERKDCPQGEIGSRARIYRVVKVSYLFDDLPNLRTPNQTPRMSKIMRDKDHSDNVVKSRLASTQPSPPLDCEPSIFVSTRLTCVADETWP